MKRLANKQPSMHHGMGVSIHHSLQSLFGLNVSAVLTAQTAAQEPLSGGQMTEKCIVTWGESQETGRPEQGPETKGLRS